MLLDWKTLPVSLQPAAVLMESRLKFEGGREKAEAVSSSLGTTSGTARPETRATRRDNAMTEAFILDWLFAPSAW